MKENRPEIIQLPKELDKRGYLSFFDIKSKMFYFRNKTDIIFVLQKCSMLLV